MTKMSEVYVQQPTQVDSKSFWKSKTFWASFVTLVAPWVPFIGPVITAHPEISFAVVSAIFAGVRAFTSQPIKLPFGVVPKG